MDEYIVKVCSNGKGPCYFYKNGKLHREFGPAITLMKKKDLIKLKEKDLYKIEIIPEENPLDYKTAYIKMPYEKLNNSVFNGIVSRSIPASYYLNGEPYLAEDFEKIKAKIELKQELSNDLNQNKNNMKKVKI